jgi:hypothetical protein
MVRFFHSRGIYGALLAHEYQHPSREERPCVEQPYSYH